MLKSYIHPFSLYDVNMSDAYIATWFTVTCDILLAVAVELCRQAWRFFFEKTFISTVGEKYAIGGLNDIRNEGIYPRIMVFYALNEAR